MNFYSAWNFLCNHEIFEIDGLSCFNARLLDIDVVKVNPSTMKIDKNEKKNTLVQVWLETGPWAKPEELSESARKEYPVGIPSHDIELDCGGNTFEEAVTKLAQLVKEKYGDN